MYPITTILSILYTTSQCANLQRYDTTDRYPSSTINNLNNQFPFKTGSYGNDIANFPEVTRYPNYSPSYGQSYTPGYNSEYSSTSRYPNYNNNYNNGYSTNGYNSLYNSGSSNVNYNNQGYNMQRYANGYGQSNGLQGGYSSYEAPFIGRDIGGCVNRSPQMGISLESLMGMWYGVELVQHLGADSRIDYARTCIVIHIAEPMDRPSTENQLFHVQHINARFRQEYRHLRLLWDEEGQTIEYALYFRNDSAGYWHVFDGQNGSLTTRHNYQQFSGTVQVLKAVNNHLVLNFCQEAQAGRQAQLYSVLFSRNPGELDRMEIDFVHSLLQNKKLSVASRRMVCGNGADKAVYSLGLSVLTGLLVYVVGSS